MSTIPAPFLAVWLSVPLMLRAFAVAAALVVVGYRVTR